MNSLEKIQKTVKVFHILSRVAMILSFVAAGIILVSIGIWCDYSITKAIGDGSSVINYFVGNAENVSFEQALCVLLQEFVYSLTSGIILAWVCSYFFHELKDGTPFTKEGAKRILHLGIKTIVLPLVAAIIVGVIYGCYGIDEPSDIENGISVMFGIGLILISLVFKYGAELEEKCREK